MLSDPTIHDTFLRVEEVNLIELVHLFQEDESEDRVGTQSGIVWGEALPQTEEALFTDHCSQYILWEGGESKAASLNSSQQKDK